MASGKHEARNQGNTSGTSSRGESSIGPVGSGVVGASQRRSEMFLGSGLANRVCATVEPFTLKQLKSKEIASFNKEYDGYCSQVAHNRSVGSEDLPAQPYMSFIEPSLLDSILKFQIKKDNATDNDVRAFLEKVRKEDNSYHDRIHMIIEDQVKMDLHLMPSTARVIDLVAQMDRVIKDHNAEALFQSELGIQNWIRWTVQSLQPYVFKKHMINMIDVAKPELRNDQVKFVDQLFEDVDKFESEVNRIVANSQHHAKPVSKKRVYEGGYGQSAKSSRYWMVSTISNREDNESAGEATVEVIFANGHVICKGILDSGADLTIIPKTVADTLVKTDSAIVLQRLSEPIHIGLPDGRTAKSTEEIFVNITLRTHAGTLVINNFRCLIWQTPKSHIFLGNDLLKHIGCDPKKALDVLIMKHDSSDHGSRNDDAIDTIIPHVGSDDQPDIIQAIKDKVQDCLREGMSKQYETRLMKLLLRRKNLFRRTLGYDQPADVTPFETHLVKGAQPYRCKARHYSAEQSEFLFEFTNTLQKFGLVYENPNSEWASPVVVVKKPSGYRMCVDLRAVNALSIATAWPMPFLEDIVQHMAKSRYWFIFDAFKGFWIMPLAEKCQEMFSFMTDRGVFTPRRSIQGALNSAVQFQARMATIFKDLFYKAIIVWIDDILGHSNTEEDWFSLLETTLERLDRHNVKLNIDKCKFFLQEVKFCGRIFRHNGVMHDPKRVQALIDMPMPSKASELQQLLMATQWMSRSIPNYNTIIVSLQQIFESAMKGQKKRTKSAAKAISLKKFGWGIEHELAVTKLKAALAENVKLSYPSNEMIQCVFCDASYQCCSGMVTQIPSEDVNKPIAEQRHQPLGFVGHRFNGSELNWAIVDKEAFAIKDTLQKLSYLLHMKRPFKLFTDHKNLISMFNPTKCTKPTADRLLRWGIELREFRYVIQHISGEINCWADILSRWGAAHDFEASPVTLNALETVESDADETIQPIDHYRVQPLDPGKFVWPDVQEIASEQRSHIGTCDNYITDGNGLLVNSDGRIIIPVQSRDLRIRLCVIAHAGCNSGHIGYNVALRLLRQRVYWVGMEKDMQQLCNACLHCVGTRQGFRIPRPLGEACHGTKRNQVLHFDYMYVWPRSDKSYHQYEWLFVLRDDFSGMVMLRPTSTPDAMTTVDALLDWRSIFGRSEVYVSDQASYFVSEVMRQFALKCNTKQHFVTAYAHYSNGSIEVINKHVQMLLRALISELRWKKDDWPWLIKLVEHTLNHRPQSRLNGLAPITVMSGLEPDNPLDVVFYNPKTIVIDSTEMLTQEVDKSVNDLQNSLTAMHKAVQQTSNLQRLRHRKKASENRRKPNFGLGDYVLVAVAQKKSSQKLFATWRGPFRVIDLMNGYVFQVENIITGKVLEIHGDRIQFYSDNKLNLTEEIKTQFAFDNATFEIERLCDVSINEYTAELQFFVKWKGFSHLENSWEPVSVIAQDAPAAIRNFLQRFPDHRLAASIRAYIS
jgi:hypothetical protein